MSASNQESNFKWLVGVIISLLAAGSGIVALLLYFNPPRQPPSEPRDGSNTNNVPSSAAGQCYISGKVYSRTSNKGLPNVEIKYFRQTKDQNEYTHDVKSRLASSDADGNFEADCSNVEAENFPLRIVLGSSNWRVTSYQTNEYIQRGSRKTGLNLYVPDNLLKSPPP